jgi:hypothetical protein
MNTGIHARSLGWMAVLGLCLGALTILSFKVHAVKSEALLAEREIVALRREIMLLETEFETRASQRQLAAWNAVEFGYQAPRADQFLSSERELASLGQRPAPDAPAPVMLARADSVGAEQANAVAAAPMRSPVSGAKVTLASARREQDAAQVFAETFADFLIDASPIRPAQAQTLSIQEGGTKGLGE